LDYADQRYYASTMGRFLTVDSGIADLANPQSFNRYAYASNDPVNGFDPTGQYTVCVGSFVGSGGINDASSPCAIGYPVYFVSHLTVAEWDDMHGTPAERREWRVAGVLNPLQGAGIISSWNVNSAGTVEIYLDLCPLPACKGLSFGLKIVVAAGAVIALAKDLKEAYDENADQKDCEKLPWPGDPQDELNKAPENRTAPGPGWTWEGPADKGQWHHRGTGESLRPHPADKDHDAHWDYIGKRRPQTGWRKYEDGNCEKKE